MARGGASTLILLAALGGGGIWAYTKYGASLGLTGPADPTKPPGTPGGPAGPPRPPGGSGGASGGSGGASGGSGGASDPDYDPGLDPTIARPTGSEITSAWVDLGVGGVAPGLAWNNLDGLVYNIDGAVMIGGPFSTVWEAQSFGRTWLGMGVWSPGIE